MIDIPCVILAGGKSSRMGEDKSLLPFDNHQTLIEYQYNKLSKIFSKVYISAKSNKFNFKCNIIYDITNSISSPMIALSSIFEFIKEDNIFIITVDTPLIKEETILDILNNSKPYDITIAEDSEKKHYLCGVFSKKIYLSIQQCISNDIHKINYLIKNTKKLNIIKFDDKNQFTNINTPLEYQNAQKLI